MSSWFVLMAFALVGLALGAIGYHFSLGVLRVAAAFVALATVVYLTWYGLTHPAKATGSLSSAFTRGADAFIAALFHLLPVPSGHRIPGPGRIGWLVIIVLLVMCYRELEAWSLRWQARSLDTSALFTERQSSQPNDPPGDGKVALTDVQRHDRLAAELKFRLPAVEVRSPAILPGGSRSSELASIAETSGVTGSGLAGAIIRFFGMLWPSPRRFRVHVWVEYAAGQAKIDDVTTVTVNLDDPATGASIATKTLAAGSLDDAACVVAGYVAQHIFAEDRTAPPWCIGAADGRDLAAILLARQERNYPVSQEAIHGARSEKIRLLKAVACSTQCAGVARYELAQLYDLTGNHVEALALHVNNREQYSRFYRGRYRLAMSLEMISNPVPETRISKDELPTLNAALKILHRCNKLKVAKRKVNYVGHGKIELPTDLRADLLDAAWTELEEIRKYLTLRHVIWQSFWHRDERGVLKPYWLLRHRQAFRDGVCVAQLLVAVRQALNAKERPGSTPALRQLPHARRLMRVAAAIAGDTSDIRKIVAIPGRAGKPSEQKDRTVTERLRTRRWPRQYSTRSWQAAYNLACTYAAIYAATAPDKKRRLEACLRKPGDKQAQDEAEKIKCELRCLVRRVVDSLEFAINNRESEMERPSEWIASDPDFSCLHSPHDQFTKHFRDFLTTQKERDYPSTSPTRHGVAAARSRHNGAWMNMRARRAILLWKP